MVQKKKLMKNNDYGISLPIGIPSQVSRVLVNQKHDNVLGEVTLNILKSNCRFFVRKYVPNITLHNISHVDKSDLAADGIVIDVPHMYGPMRNHHLIQMSFGEET